MTKREGHERPVVVAPFRFACPPCACWIPDDRAQNRPGVDGRPMKGAERHTPQGQVASAGGGEQGVPINQSKLAASQGGALFFLRVLHDASSCTSVFCGFWRGAAGGLNARPLGRMDSARTQAMKELESATAVDRSRRRCLSSWHSTGGDESSGQLVVLCSVYADHPQPTKVTHTQESSTKTPLAEMLLLSRFFFAQRTAWVLPSLTGFIHSLIDPLGNKHSYGRKPSQTESTNSWEGIWISHVALGGRGGE